jgi:hypothetical protein
MRQIADHLQANPAPQSAPKYQKLSTILLSDKGEVCFAPEFGIPKRIHEKALAEVLRSFMDMAYPEDGVMPQIQQATMADVPPKTE